DYVDDQVAAGKDVQLATEEVISQFKVQEISDDQLSKDTFFFHSHNYLIGNGLVLLSIFIIFFFLCSHTHSVIFVSFVMLYFLFSLFSNKFRDICDNRGARFLFCFWILVTFCAIQIFKPPSKEKVLVEICQRFGLLSVFKVNVI